VQAAKTVSGEPDSSGVQKLHQFITGIPIHLMYGSHLLIYAHPFKNTTDSLTNRIHKKIPQPLQQRPQTRPFAVIIAIDIQPIQTSHTLPNRLHRFACTAHRTTLSHRCRRTLRTHAATFPPAALTSGSVYQETAQKPQKVSRDGSVAARRIGFDWRRRAAVFGLGVRAETERVRAARSDVQQGALQPWHIQHARS